MKIKISSLAISALLATPMLVAHAADRVCDPDIPTIAPDSRFEILADGKEVKDKKTGLIWQRCSIGQSWDGTTCSGDPTSLTWQQALQQAKSAGNGYHLPSFKEAASLSDPGCTPAMNTNIFFNMPVFSYYWTSTPNALKDNQVLYYNFYSAQAVYQQIYYSNKDMYGLAAFGYVKPVYALLVRSE